MARLRVVVLSALGLLLLAPPAGADAPTAREQALSRENAELKSQVDALRAEVRALRDALRTRPGALVVPPADLKGLPDGLKIIPRATVPATTPALPSDSMPQGTVRRQFNGATVYIIPLAPEGAPPAVKR